MFNELLERLWNEQADEFNQWDALGLDEKLEFAALVEREACSKVCDEYPMRNPAEDGNGYWAAEECAKQIRMRSNDQHYQPCG